MDLLLLGKLCQCLGWEQPPGFFPGVQLKAELCFSHPHWAAGTRTDPRGSRKCPKQIWDLPSDFWTHWQRDFWSSFEMKFIFKARCCLVLKEKVAESPGCDNCETKWNVLCESEKNSGVIILLYSFPANQGEENALPGGSGLGTRAAFHPSQAAL